MNQVFELNLVPLILKRKNDEGELFRGNTFSLASNNGSKSSGSLFLGISVLDAVEDGGLVLGVNDVGLEDFEGSGLLIIERVGGKEGSDLFAVEGESSDGGLEENVSLETAFLHSDE